MIRVPWSEEEAVALFDLYFREGVNASLEEINRLSLIYNARARRLGLTIDEKFRNVHGIKMQLGCVHYIVTDGHEGISNASKLFYKIYSMYRDNHDRYDQLLEDFFLKYKL